MMMENIQQTLWYKVKHGVLAIENLQRGWEIDVDGDSSIIMMIMGEEMMTKIIMVEEKTFLYCKIPHSDFSRSPGKPCR